MVPIACLFTGSVSFEVTVDFLLGKRSYNLRSNCHLIWVFGVDLHQATVGHVLGKSAGSEQPHPASHKYAGREDHHGRNWWERKFIS